MKIDLLELDEQHAVGVKNATFSEPFFQGHFPAEPVMPGVLVLEECPDVLLVDCQLRHGSSQSAGIGKLLLFKHPTIGLRAGYV